MREGSTETDISALDASGRTIDTIPTTLAVIMTNRDFVMFFLPNGEPPDVVLHVEPCLDGSEIPSSDGTFGYRTGELT